MPDSTDPSSLLTRRFSRVTIVPGSPLVFSDEAAAGSLPAGIDHTMLDQVGRTIEAYILAAKELLRGKHSALAKHAPPYLREPCSPFALICSDGIIVRYERGPNAADKVATAAVAESVAEWAPRLSEHMVFCPSDTTNFDPGPGGIEIKLVTTDPSGQRSEHVSFRILIVAPLSQDQASVGNYQARRPVARVSVRNEFDVHLGGEILPRERAGEGRPQPFVMRRSRARLPVGWDAIDVYPPFDSTVWRPDFASMWAELDLLAMVATRNLKDAEFRAIDPHADARRRFARLLAEFERLLQGPEEPVHQFVKDNPVLLSPTHTLCRSKLPLGGDITDFVLREPGADYVFVELEAPTRELFRANGQMREELVHAHHQILRWQRYIEDNLGTVQRELDLPGLSVQPRFLIVIGRSSSLTEDNHRYLTTLQNQVPKLRIMTYDDVLASATSMVENLFGPLWNISEDNEVWYLPAS